MQAVPRRSLIATSNTAPIREEHAELLPEMLRLQRIASELKEWDEAAAASLDEVVSFLQDHLLPHAGAEEEVLYPAIEDAMGVSGGTETMRADHAEILRRIERLAELVAGAPVVEDVRAELYGLSAILVLHFRKEEDVLLPILDRELTPEAAAGLFRRMGEAAHRHD